MNVNKQMITVIITFIAGISLAVFMNGEKNIAVTRNSNDNYLVSLNGAIGLMDIERQTFEALYDTINVFQIVGITKKGILTIGENNFGDGTFRSSEGIYILNKTGLKCLASDVSKAYLSPDGNHVAYITFPDGGLKQIGLNTDSITHIADSVGYFGSDNIWSPDSMKIAIVNANSGMISVYNTISKQYYQCLQLNTGKTIYLGWFDKSSLLVKVADRNHQYIASYNINDEKITYLFNKEADIYNAVCTNNSIVGFKIDPQDPHNWNVVIALKTSPDKVSNLFTLPYASDQASTDEKPFLFWSEYKPISESQLFYRVLECETHRPMYCGIIDVNSRTVKKLDKAITSLWAFPAHDDQIQTLTSSGNSGLGLLVDTEPTSSKLEFRRRPISL